jgi:phosphoribosylpyrophosphate synthetase
MKAKGVVTILKRRLEANRVDSMQIVGDVNGAYVVIVDDMIDTGYPFSSSFFSMEPLILFGI